jgi:hypothetical protein
MTMQIYKSPNAKYKSKIEQKEKVHCFSNNT